VTRYPTRRLPVVAVLGAFLGASLGVFLGASLVAGIVWPDTGHTRPIDPAPPDQVDVTRGPVAVAPEVDVLRSWDLRRASAYSRGDVASLRALYVDGARAADADARMLREYTRRGLRLEGMQMQILAVEVLARRTGLWRLRVTDRLVGAVAIGPSGHNRLPRDQASTNVVTLVRSPSDDEWRVASVR